MLTDEAGWPGVAEGAPTRCNVRARRRQHWRNLRNRRCSTSTRVVRIERRATLAQLVERLIRNQQVAGSIPAGGSIFSAPCKRKSLMVGAMKYSQGSAWD